MLLLDNCEHVLEPIAELVEQLLARCPGLVVVATTPERLRVAGEQLCPVAPLPILEHGGPADELFVERARAVRPGYVPDAADAARISEIVRRLDGLPLAIELAAARLHTMDVAEVADGLDRRFRLLAAGQPHGVPAPLARSRRRMVVRAPARTSSRRSSATSRRSSARSTWSTRPPWRPSTSRRPPTR